MQAVDRHKHRRAAWALPERHSQRSVLCGHKVVLRIALACTAEAYTSVSYYSYVLIYQHDTKACDTPPRQNRINYTLPKDESSCMGVTAQT